MPTYNQANLFHNWRIADYDDQSMNVSMGGKWWNGYYNRPILRKDTSAISTVSGGPTGLTRWLNGGGVLAGTGFPSLANPTILVAGNTFDPDLGGTMPTAHAVYLHGDSISFGPNPGTGVSPWTAANANPANDLRFGNLKDTLLGEAAQAYGETQKFAVFDYGIGGSTFDGASSTTNLLSTCQAAYGVFNHFGTNNVSKPAGVKMMLVIFCGTNDINGGASNATMLAALTAITDAAKTAQIDSVIYCNTIPRTSAGWTNHASWHTYIAANKPASIDVICSWDSIAALNGAADAGVAPYFMPAQGGSGISNIHPNKISYELMGAVLKTTMDTEWTRLGVSL